jgi:hypothetical protein
MPLKNMSLKGGFNSNVQIQIINKKMKFLDLYIFFAHFVFSFLHPLLGHW